MPRYDTDRPSRRGGFGFRGAYCPMNDGPSAHFFFRKLVGLWMKVNHAIHDLIEPVVEGMGFELVGVEFDGHQRVLRLYIDHPDGIGLEACSRVSYQVSGVLDVEDPIPGRYQLEVSSPGMDRPLFKRAHFERFEGAVIRVQVVRPIEGRRRYKGTLSAIEGEEIVLTDEEGKVFRIPFSQIDRARLVPDFEM